MSNNKHNWIGYWLFILAVPLSIILAKAIPHTDWFKDLGKHARIKASIIIDAKLVDNNLTMRIRNSSHYSFKDLVVNCGYEAASGTHLGEDSFTVYQAFFRGDERILRNLGGGDIPHQTHIVSCVPVDFIEMTDQESEQLEKKLLDDIFGVDPNISSNLVDKESTTTSLL